MLKQIKRIAKSAFRVANIDIHRIPEYEKNKFVWLIALNINTVLDIGANIGQFALEISKFLPNANICSFEPLRDVFAELIKNTRNIKNFRAFNFAIGDLNGTANIKRNKFSPSSSLLGMAELHKEAFPFTQDIYEEEIMIKRLDYAIKEDIELVQNILIKLDVQGYEDKVIVGGKETFAKAKVVIAEVSYYELYKGQVLFDGFYDELRKIGFKYKGNINNSFHPRKGLPLFADAVFIKGS